MLVDMNSQWLQDYSRIMDVLTVQHKTVAQNIANTNTPGYTRKTVDFASELEKVFDQSRQPEKGNRLQSPASGSDFGWRPEVEAVEDKTSARRQDGNNVNLETEMVDISQVSQVYSMMSKLSAMQIKMARYVISGGRG